MKRSQLHATVSTDACKIFLMLGQTGALGAMFASVISAACVGRPVSQSNHTSTFEVMPTLCDEGRGLQ